MFQTQKGTFHLLISLGYYSIFKLNVSSVNYAALAQPTSNFSVLKQIVYYLLNHFYKTLNSILVIIFIYKCPWETNRYNFINTYHLLSVQSIVHF